MTTDPDVLALLGAWEPSRPRLTWYGADAERVELSGRTLRTWVVKAANLLHTEADAGPGSRVLVALPPHWRALVWWLGVRAVGAEPVEDRPVEDRPVEDRPGTSPVGRAPDVVLTHEPGTAPGAEVVIAVPLPALARAWDAELPDGALDGAAELMAQPDDPVFAGALARVPVPDTGPRVLLTADGPVPPLAARAWEIWSAGGSVVLVTPRPPAEVTAIAEQENVTPAP